MTFNPSRLYTALLNTGLQQKDNPLYQVLHNLIDNVITLNDQTSSVLADFRGPLTIPTYIVIGSIGSVTPSPGDLVVNRGSSGYGAIYFGPTGLAFLDWDGVNWNFQPSTGLVNAPNFNATASIFAALNVSATGGYIKAGGSVAFAPNLGDIIANRGGVAPGTGYLFLGNSAGAHYIGYDGTQLTTNDAFVSTGGRIGSNFGMTSGPIGLNTPTAGDLVVSRGGNPGSGAIYFGGSASSHFLFYDGTNFNITDPLSSLSVVGSIIGTGLVSIQTINDGSDSLRLGSGGFYYGFARSNITGSLYIQGNQAGANFIVLAPTSGNVGIGAEPTTLFSVIEKFQVNSSGYIPKYNNIVTKGIGVSSVYGLDNRTGLTTADGAATTLYTTVAANNIFRVSADIFATAAVTGTATYTIKWTENGTTQSMAVTSTVINTLGTASNLIRPDNATTITFQLTGVFTGTFTVVGLVEQVA